MLQENKTLICNKGDIDLYFYENEGKCYNIEYRFNKLNPNKVNINSILGIEIYMLLEKINIELIEKILILSKISDDCHDVVFFIKDIAKEVGIKQKYILFRTTRIIDFENNEIIFKNLDLSLINNELKNKYISEINIDNKKFDPLIFNFGETILKVNSSTKLYDILFNQNLNDNIDIDFKINFKLTISDELPIYMENLLGLMFKKIFYNLKLFIEKINTN